MSGKRNMSVEAFRCMMMFLIVLGHSASFWWRAKGIEFGGMPYWLFVMVGLLVWHVDGFIGISGWYGVKFSFGKFLRLLAMILFYGVLGAALRCAVHGEPFSLTWLWNRGGWFMESYLALMLCSPLLNAGVEGLAAKSKKALLSAWAMLAFVFTVSWIPKHLFTGINAIGFGHHTFLLMAFVYLTARTARKLFEGREVKAKALYAVVALYALFVFAYSAALPKIASGERIWALVSGNHAPMVIAAAMAMMMTFVRHVKIPGWLEKIVAKIAPSMFGVYLFHQSLVRYNGTSSVMSGATVAKIVGSMPGPLVIFLAAIAAFAASVAVDMARRLAVRLVWR